MSHPKSKEARDAFRRFMGVAPDAFDFAAAQIPSPLTAEVGREFGSSANHISFPHSILFVCLLRKK